MLFRPHNDPLEARLANFERLLQKHGVDIQRLWGATSRTAESYIGQPALNDQLAPPTRIITGATNATPIVITSAANRLLTGATVTITNVRGNTAANGTWVITAINGDTFSLNGSVGNGAYVANRTVTGASNTAPIVITSNSHGLANGATVKIRDVLGNTAANGSWVIGGVTTNTFQLLGSTGNGTYTSGGLVNAGEWS